MPGRPGKGGPRTATVVLGAAAAVLLTAIGAAAPARAGAGTAVLRGDEQLTTGQKLVTWSNGVRIVTPPASAATEVAALTNAERARAGCAALRVESRLTTAAQGHATAMATDNYFSHTSLDGRTFDQRIRNAGHPSPGGENIARGQSTPASVLTAWMNSAGHRANIVNCAFTAIGVGYDSRGDHWVQNFGS